MKPILFTFAFAATLAAQNLIQRSDPQVGMFTKDASFEHETVNFEFAIATANRLKPAFVVITGDLINKGGDAAQAAEFKRISAKLDPKVRLFSIPGNHDVGNEPTAESLALYRERFGRTTTPSASETSPATSGVPRRVCNVQLRVHREREGLVRVARYCARAPVAESRLRYDAERAAF